MALTTSPGLLFEESSSPNSDALIAVPVLSGIVIAGPCCTGFLSALFCAITPPESAIARSAIPNSLVVIGGLPSSGLEDRSLLDRQYHQVSVQYQRQIVNPLFAVYILRLGLLVSTQFAVIVPDSYHLGVAFPPHPIDTSSRRQLATLC